MKFIFEIIEIKHRIEKFRLEKGAKFYDFLKKLCFKKLDFIKNLIVDNFNKNLVILAIILLSFLWRSSLDYEAFSSYNLDRDDKIQNIDNLLAFNNLQILNFLANLVKISANIFAFNSLFIAELIINLVGIFSLYFSNKILKNCHNIEKNLLLILMTIIYFLPPRNFIENSLESYQKNEFFTDYFINLALMMPIISYLFLGKNNLKIISKFIICLLTAILILQNIYFIILLPFLNYEFFLNPKKNYQNILLQIVVLVALILDLAIIKYFYNYWVDGVKINFLKTFFSSFDLNFKNSFNSFAIIKFSRLYYDFIAFFILYFLGFFSFFMLNKTEFNKNFLALIFGIILIYFAQNFNTQIGNLLQALLIIFLIFNVKFYHKNLVKIFYKYWFILLIILIAGLYSLDFKFLITHLIFWSFPVIFLGIFLTNFRNKIFFNQNIIIILLTILLICLGFFLKILSLKIYFVINFIFALWCIIYLVKIGDFNERLVKSMHFLLILILFFAFSDIFGSLFRGISTPNINSSITQIIVQKTSLVRNQDDKILMVSANFMDFYPTKNYYPTKIHNLHLNILSQNDFLLINNYKINDIWFSIMQNYQDNLVNDFVDDFLSQIQNSQPKFVIFFNKDLCNIGLIEFLLRNSKFQSNFIKNYEFFDNYSINYFNKTFKYQPLQENLSNYEFDLIKEIHKIRSEIWQLPNLEIYKKTN